MIGVSFRGGAHIKNARCPCCIAVVERTGWKPGDPVDDALCDACKAAGCRHRYEQFFARGEGCPMRQKTRKASAVGHAAFRAKKAGAR